MHSRPTAVDDPHAAWHVMRVTFDEDCIEDSIRGYDRTDAMANAVWNWPAAVCVQYVRPEHE